MDPFTDLQLLNWYEDLLHGREGIDVEDLSEIPPEVTVIGDGPISSSHLISDLERRGIKCMLPWPQTEVAILGRQHWREDELYSLLTHRRGCGLRVYTQEMFLIYVATDLDPFEYADLAVLECFAAGHPAFGYLREQSFDWPSTVVWGGGVSPVGHFPIQTGLLGYLGYHVGIHGLSVYDRRRILSRAFERPIPTPRFMPQVYIEDWARPRTCARLQKMAISIASFCKLAKRRRPPPVQAIRDWEDDLAWLKREYYGLCDFRWPE